MESKIIQSHCPYCDRELACELKFYVSDNCSNEDYFCDVTSAILICQGCRRSFFRQTTRDEMDCDYDQHGTPLLVPSHVIFPPPRSKLHKYHQPREDVLKLLMNRPEAKFVEDLYLEICEAVNRDNPIVSALGLRSLINALSIIKTGSVDFGFEKNLNELKDAGFLSTNQKDLLSKVLEIGHAATHRLTSPSMSDIISCLKSTEHLIDSIFMLPDIDHKLPNLKRVKGTKK